MIALNALDNINFFSIFASYRCAMQFLHPQRAAIVAVPFGGTLREI